jgi:excisionase family DNA binding protein
VNEVLTVPETAELLRVSHKVVYQMFRRGKLPGAVKVGGQIRVNRAVLLAWMSGQQAA